MREEERKIIEETRRERERQRIIEERIVARCRTQLELGSISRTQIEDWLKLQGVSNPVVDRLANNVRASL